MKRTAAIIFYASWTAMALLTSLVLYERARDRHNYDRAEVGGFMICTNPNVMGRLECLPLPEGSILLVPARHQEGPQNAPTTTH